MRRWALITGSSAGIGAAFCRVFARNGFDIVLTARREDKLRELASDLERDHGVLIAGRARDLRPSRSK